MANASTEFLVDTNILIYAIDAKDDAKRRRAIEVLRRVHASGRGCLTTQVLGEFYFNAIRKPAVPLGRAEAERALRVYSLAWPILEFGVIAVREAARAASAYQLSYFDALIWATAREHGVPQILSEDRQNHQSLEGVRIVNPLVAEFDLALLD
jgi:predicted nucleic acid-binding protein